LLEYDDVANEQRKVIYTQRNEILAAESVEETIKAIRDDVVQSAVAQYMPPNSLPEQWDIPGLEQHLRTELALDLPVQRWLEEDDSLQEDGVQERVREIGRASCREGGSGEGVRGELE